MSPSQIVTKLVLDALGQPMELGAFDRRLEIQKKVYLAQLAGVDLGYRFGWYLRGPYCRELTSDVFQIREQLEGGDNDWKREDLRPSVRKNLEGAKRIWANRPSDVKETDWLELLASLHYLKHIAFWPGGTPASFDRIYAALVDSKPRFKGRKAHARLAWDQLRSVGLLDKKLLRVA